MHRRQLQACKIKAQADLQCRLKFAEGQCDAGTKTELHDLLPEGKKQARIVADWRIRVQCYFLERPMAAGNRKIRFSAG
jgi:hypothetical protein